MYSTYFVEPVPGWADDLVDGTNDLINKEIDNINNLKMDVKIIWNDTMQKIQDLQISQKLENFKNKIDLDDLLNKFIEAQKNEKGAKALEDYFTKLINENPEAKQDLEKINNNMMSVLPESDAANSIKSNTILFLIVLQAFAYFLMN